MHSPLYGIDVYDAKDRRLARRLSENMRIPIRDFDCGGVCHGTLTQWFNKNHKGACVTVEFGTTRRRATSTSVRRVASSARSSAVS